MSGLVRKVVECFFDSSAAELGLRSLFGKPPSTWSAEPLSAVGCWVCSLLLLGQQQHHPRLLQLSSPPPVSLDTLRRRCPGVDLI